MFAALDGAEPEERPHISRRNSTGPQTAGFDRFDLRPELLKAVAAAEFTTTRPVQAKCIPPGLKGRDVLGLAQTGTGKTAAFVLPILQRLLNKRGKSSPRALVIAPTRELAAQVQKEFERLAKFTPISSTVVFGGVPANRQIRALKQRPEVVVACPGRLLDLLGQGALHLDGVEVLVLDEADHMFDMGFLPDIRRILDQLPQRRQNLLFSATMPREIRKLADRVLRDPAVVELANSQPAETIQHGLLRLDEADKVPVLEDLLHADEFRSAIVFLRTKRRAKRLAERLSRNGHNAVSLQGNMSQGQRERALKGFREGQYDVLVATDIAARGLDIIGVSHVVNFDLPNTPDAYTHRIGRTGRSEMTGKAYTFVTPNDGEAVRAIEKRLGARIDLWKTGKLGTSARAQSGGPLQGGRSSQNGRSRQGGFTRQGGRAGSQAGRRGRTVRPQRSSTRPPIKAVESQQPKKPRAAFGSGVDDPAAEGRSRGASRSTTGSRRRRRA